MYRRWLIAIVGLQFAWTLQGVQAQGSAGQAGEFLRAGIGAKALGLGRAFTSLADDASALYWNPAGLSRLSTIGGTFMFVHMPLDEGASLNYLAGALPLRLLFTNSGSTNDFIKAIQDLKLGFGVLWHSLGEFQSFDEIGNPLESNHSISQTAIYFSASYPVNNLLPAFSNSGFLNVFKGDIEFGVTTKLVRNDLFGASGSATSLDLGFKYTHFSRWFSFGFAWRDLNTPKINYKTEVTADRIPANAALGVSLYPRIEGLHGLSLSFDYGIITPAKREHDVMFGMEYDFSTISSQVPLKLRIGTNSNHESFTVGMNFSPEVMVGKDWFPYGDITYARRKNGFSQIRSEYSIAIDRNPFTARYWYTKGVEEASMGNPACFDLNELSANAKARSYFENALKANNPGNHAYRFDAALRIVDIDFMQNLKRLRDASERGYDTAQLEQRFTEIGKAYHSASSRYLLEDSGKPQIDTQQYFDSFVFYLHSLVFSANYSEAIAACKARGTSWAKQLDVLVSDSSGAAEMRPKILDYLQAYSLHREGKADDAVRLIKDRLSSYPLAKYLEGHLAFLAERYQDALDILHEFDLNDAQFPDLVSLPLMNDCTIGDEALFLRATSLYKLNGNQVSEECLAMFAQIPRFFPESDLGRFLTNGEQVLTKLTDSFIKGQQAELKQLIERMIESYLKAFSEGTLKEEAYTLNYQGDQVRND